MPKQLYRIYANMRFKDELLSVLNNCNTEVHQTGTWSALNVIGLLVKLDEQDLSMLNLTFNLKSDNPDDGGFLIHKINI